MHKYITFIILLFTLNGCSVNEDKLITPVRVGKVTFEQEIPDMGKGYVTKRDTVYLDGDEGLPYFWVEDKHGNLIAKVFTQESIEVFSPEFKTETGIHPGMNLHEAAKIIDEENLNAWLGWPNNYFTIEDVNTGLAWNVYGDQMKGGWDAFQKYSMNGTGEIKLSDFTPEATIGWITVIYNNSED